MAGGGEVPDRRTDFEAGPMMMIIMLLRLPVSVGPTCRFRRPTNFG
jgi:hypothetical protein